MNIPLIKPYIDDAIKQQVVDVLESGYLTEGPVTRKFEEKFREYIGCNYSIALTSATTALECALRVLKIGSGDEVIVPDYTYPATANVVAIVGAKAVIVDICKETMLIDYDEIEKAITPKTKAIIPVSIFGNPLDYSILNRIKEKYNLFIIEDAACALGSQYKSVKIGNQADISVFSLHPRKFITTGEGGMLTTNNSEWGEWINSYKHFGMEMANTAREGVKFNIIGTNYKLSNLQAAVGLGQFEHIDLLLNRRGELAENYVNLIGNNPNITLPNTTKPGLHSYQSFCIFVENRDEKIKYMRLKGIETQIGTYALHQHKAFINNDLIEIKGAMANSLWVYEHCLTLPLYHDLKFEEQAYIIKCLNDFK
jgi:dTDP-4-amino-4,6-dideoxygalactose transaminase